MKRIIAFFLVLALVLGCVSFAAADGDLFEITNVAVEETALNYWGISLTVRNKTGGSVRDILLNICLVDDEGNILGTTTASDGARLKADKSIAVNTVLDKSVPATALYVDSVEYTDSNDQYHKAYLDETEDFPLNPVSVSVPAETPESTPEIRLTPEPTPEPTREPSKSVMVVINEQERTGTYEGDLANGVPEGQGRFESTDSLPKAVYIGGWAGGSVRGAGELQHDGFTIHFDTVSDGKYDRAGVFSGRVVDGVPNGKGTFSAQNSEGVKWTYTGEFKDGAFNGKGEMTWENGQKYTGDFANGEFNGYGVFTYQDEDNNWVTLEGHFKDGDVAFTVSDTVRSITQNMPCNLYDSSVRFIDAHEDLFVSETGIDPELVNAGWNSAKFKTNPEDWCDRLVCLKDVTVLEAADGGEGITVLGVQDSSGGLYVGVYEGKVVYSINSVIDEICMLPLDWIKGDQSYAFVLFTLPGNRVIVPVVTPEPTPVVTPAPTAEPTPEPTPEPTEVPSPTPVAYELPTDMDRSITFGEEEWTVAVGKQLKLVPEITKVKDDAPAKTTLDWSSSDESVAKVNAQGAVIGVAPGYAFICCSAKDKPEIKAYVPVRVIQPIKSIALEENNIILLLGGSEEAKNRKINVVFTPDNASVKKCSFVSSDESIVTVNENGNLQALALGQAKITVIPLEDGTKAKAVCNVIVAQAVTSVTVPEAQTLAKGKSFTLAPEILPANATYKTLEYSSSDAKVATVAKNGAVKGVGCGEAVITCKATDGSGVVATCKVTVIQAVTGIKLSERSITLGGGKKQRITTTVSPQDATNKKVKWSTSNSSVASVGQDGTVIANGGGDCEITCTTEEGSFSAKVAVHVPVFSVNSTEYTVYSKSGITIPVNWAASDGSTVWMTDNGGTCFDANWDADSNVKIVPKKAGKGSIIIYSEKYPKDRVTITVIVDHDAAYDTTSYPKIDYESAARYPDAYKGDKCSFSGKVLQVMSDTNTTSYLISSKGRYDNYVYVTINNSDIITPVLKDDMVTVYGKHDGNYSYTTVMGAGTTVPKVKAERIDVK